MWLRNRYLHTIVGCALVLSAAGGAQEHGNTEHPWDYSTTRGPGHWGDLKPEFASCKSGHRQSPIHIRDPQKADLPPIQFDYKPSPLNIVDNGHTIMVNYSPGSFIIVGGKRYELKQFHFHMPSEEKINGKGYDMVVHLVHADANGNIAVVSVLLEKGEGNDLIRRLWTDLPEEKDKVKVAKDVEIDADGLLPADRSYYTFTGSLTTPPCSEEVTWFVLKHPVSVSAAEIEQFSKLYRNNARPTQPLYDRVVLESK